MPVDVFLTETMIDQYEQLAPSLVGRLKSSAMISMSYHVRPPKPYYTGYNTSNWSGLGSLTGSAAGQPLYNAIYNYETHGLNLATGQATGTVGGFAKLNTLFGYNGIVVGAQTDVAFGAAVATVFHDLGAKFTIRHNVVNNLGTVTNFPNTLYVKPEQYEIRLIERFEDGFAIPAATAFDSALAAARIATSGTGTGTSYSFAPYFMGVKLHDNDLFATQSAWTTVYQPPTGRKTPNWNPALAQDPIYNLDAATQTARFAYYAQMVQYAAANRARLGGGIKLARSVEMTAAPRQIGRAHV